MASADPRIIPPKPPDSHACGIGDVPTSKTLGNPNCEATAQKSYASVVSGKVINPQPMVRPRFSPRFPPIALPSRQVGTKEGRPAISFTAAEIGACEKRFEFSLVAKFTVGRPSIGEIQAAFQNAWNLAGRATISEIWDGRHVLIILDSEADVRVALSSPLHKVGHAFFRLFRWSSDYNPKTESRFSTIWIRLQGLPLELYDVSFIEAIVSTFGYFVAVDDRTKACVAVKHARACVELDVTKPIPDSVWISLPNDKGYWQSIEVETNIRYCSKCRVHGHTVQTCRKHAANSTKPSKEGIASVPKIHVGREATNVRLQNLSVQGSQKEAVSKEQWIPVTSKKGANKTVKSSVVAEMSVDAIKQNDKIGAGLKETAKAADESRKLKAVRGSYVTRDQQQVDPGFGGVGEGPPVCLEMVVFEPPTVHEGVSDGKGDRVQNGGSSAEVHFDEYLQSHVHPNGVEHYTNIKKKIGSGGDMPGEISYITQRSKKKNNLGSKHCLPSSSP